MSKIQEVIVVEGKADTQAVQHAVDADTLETNGSALSADTIAAIQSAAQQRGVIVFTDPDFNGERLRQLITQAVPDAKHAFLTKDEAGRQIKHHSLGIEYADRATIQKALADVVTVTDQQTTSDVTRQALLKLGLLAGPQAAQLRQQVSEKLKLGYVNGKQFLKRLQMFGVNQATLEKTIQEIKEENA
ncbi:ribonuclease M5 [Weissella uvarum]|uniref:ribonuclease M5 n=1 Tax=Weissella uvarum TaxID=1479233 RepID=UPI00195F3518|nr:ribonuclease M5 [Weissella uvarum]MBM7618028.1 ribonuclease M5 [Weissella uvarum]MCM0595115.1 ribonuclease M5 [Weissella uvarum]